MNNQQDNQVVYLRLDDIIPNRFQPREIFDETGLEELADSIKEHGVIQPIIVRKIGDKYELIAGERRCKASALAGLTTIPSIIRNMDDKESAKVSLLENLQRKNLSAIEEARTYKRILELDNMTQEDLAKTMGRSQPMIANKLRLLSLPEEIQEALIKNQISERHARSLLTLPNKKTQLMFLDKIRNERLTVRELDAKIKEYKENNLDDTKENFSNENEERFMNNNRGNFGGMGLNDYQSGINNSMFSNIPNKFNNMPNIEISNNNPVNYNNFNEANDFNFQEQPTNQFNSSSLEQTKNNVSLASMLDENNNYNTKNNEDNMNLFVSHIREDNIPKSENQFLPNFDNFNNSQFNNTINGTANSNKTFNDLDNNINSQNMYTDNTSNLNNYQQEINNNSSFITDSFNNNQYNSNTTDSTSFENNINDNYMNNQNDNISRYNLNNNLSYETFNNNYNEFTNEYSDVINNPYQGNLFNQPLNIIENNSNYDIPNTEESIEQKEYNLENKFNDNPLDDQYENILYAKPVPIQEENNTSNQYLSTNNENDIEKNIEFKNNDESINENISDIEIIGDVDEPQKENNNQYIKLEPEKTITNTMDAILELKRTTDAIKMNNIPIETEEIDFGDVYQITIKLKKTE